MSAQSLHIALLALGLIGFAALALATERHAEHLLGRVPAPTWRHLARAAGWSALAISLALGVGQLGAGVGITLWLGWLAIAALVLVFALPKWPWQPPARPVHARKPRPEAVAILAASPPRRLPTRWIAASLLVATVAGFCVALSATGTRPLMRDDALHGQVGPWRFTLAEADRHAPEVVAMDVPIKAFALRFCEACDLDVAHAFLKVNKPRSSRATGMAFEGARWDRRVEIQLPATLRADSELWLTVVGKDGQVHQTHWRMDQVAPATVAWFEQQRNANGRE